MLLSTILPSGGGGISVQNAEITDLGNVTGTVNIDPSITSVFKMTLTGNVTLSFSSIVSQNTLFTVITLIIYQDATGSRTVTMPSGMKWPYGVTASITSTANSVSLMSFFTTDNGTTWNAYSSGNDYK